MEKRLWLVLLLSLASGGGIANRVSASPLVPPQEIIPLREIRPGMRGYGLTVFRGSRPSRFEVTVVDILRRAYMGQDMLLIRMQGGPITQRGALLIAGMSGSPIYLRGRLAGAVSMGYYFPREPVAIVTPIQAMSEALDPRLPRRPMLTSVPRGEDGSLLLLARQAGDPGEAIGALRPLLTPVTTRGLSPAGSRFLARLLRPYGFQVAAGIGGEARRDNTPLQPGSALGVSLVCGDIEITTSGTLTYRKGNRVLAFGHPMFQLGPVDLPMTRVWVHDVWCGVDQSFRLDSPGGIVGSITQDRPFSVAGVVGKTPRLVPVEIAVRDASTGRSQRLSLRAVDHPLLTASLIQTAAGEALLRARPVPGEAMARVELRIDAAGFAPLVRRNTAFDYFDPNGFDYATLRDLGELLSILSANPFGQVPVRRVRLSVNIIPGRKTAVLERLSVDRDRVEPGGTVRVTATLRPWKGTPVVRTLQVKIPSGAPDGRAYLTVSGGASGLPPRPSATGGVILLVGGGRAGQGEPAASVHQLVRRYLERERNDEIAARLFLPSPSLNVGGERLIGLPSALADVMRSSKATGSLQMMEEVRQRCPVEWVVTGAQAIPITIQRRVLSERRPPQPPPSGTPGPPPPLPQQPTPAPVGATASDDFDTMEARLAASAPERKPEAPSALESPPGGTEPDGADEPQPEPDRPPERSSAARKRPGRPTILWVQRSYRDWERGEAHGTAVSTAGSIELAPSVAPVHRLTRDRVAWALAVGPTGDVYFGTATEGRVYHRLANGRIRLVLDAAEPAIQALALDAQGNLYAGAGPGGVIYRVPAGSGASGRAPVLFYRTGQRYVLSLAVDASGNVYAGTGNAGRIYRITPQGKGEVYFTTPEPHVLRLALDRNGALLAGTAEPGIVYRITGRGRGAAVIDTGDRAVGGLAVDPEGRVVAGTAPRGLILREGLARPVHEARAPVLSLACADGGRIYAGAGSRLVCADGVDNATLLECADQCQLLALALDQRGRVWASTGNGAGLYLLRPPAAQGTFDSVVRDAETQARWGRIAWEATVPEGASVTIQTRSGNTAEPDASWSPWSPEYTDASGSPVQSPPARFIQYRAVLRAGKGGASPVLKSVTLSYLPQNRPPRVEWRTPLVGTAVSGKVSLSWTGSDPDRDALTYELFYSPDGGRTWHPMQPAAPDKPADRQRGNGGSPPSAGAKDEKPAPPIPAHAPAAFPEGASQPATAAIAAPAASCPPGPPAFGKPGPVTGTSFRWETAGLPDGPYLLKIVASDARSNPGDACVAEQVVGPILLSNAKPKVTLVASSVTRDSDGRVTVRGRAEDPHVPVASISFRVDGGDWLAAAPADGMLDSRVEEFTLTTEKLAPGPHRVEVEVINLADGSATETLEVR